EWRRDRHRNLSVGKAAQRLERRIGRCGARAVHHCRQEDVVPVQTQQLYDALLAEHRDGATIRVVTDAFVAQNLGREIVRRLFVGRHVDGTPSVRDRFANFAPQSGLGREGVVHLPLDLLRPLAAHDEDRKLGDPLREDALEAQRIAHLFGGEHQIRAAEQWNERTEDGPLAVGQELANRSFLRGRVLLERDRRQPVATAAARERLRTSDDRGGDAGAHGRHTLLLSAWLSLLARSPRAVVEVARFNVERGSTHALVYEAATIDAATTGCGALCETTSRTSVANRRAAGLIGRGTYIENAMSGSGGNRSAAPRTSMLPERSSAVRHATASPASRAARRPARLGVRSTTLYARRATRSACVAASMYPHGGSSTAMGSGSRRATSRWPSHTIGSRRTVRGALRDWKQTTKSSSPARACSSSMADCATWTWSVTPGYCLAKSASARGRTRSARSCTVPNRTGPSSRSSESAAMARSLAARIS